ncbi:MAG: radical SAM protein [Spirochaetales bacterium]|nr:radical SAM protein [Spirochaetales bacterium]
MDGFDGLYKELYSHCMLCPRQCGVDRLKGERGFCGETSEIRIASACLHFGEEPPISGTGGSGTVFFSGCTLRCRFCQNYQISREGMGGTVTADELCGIFLTLQKRGAENINLVTATHFIPGVIRAVLRAKEAGLLIPVVWNSSGFEETDILKLLDVVVDIYIPDMKTLDGAFARRFFYSPSYPEKAVRAISLMSGKKTRSMENGMLKSGLVMRHLVIPGGIPQTRAVLEWYKNNLEPEAMLSLMFQFIPVGISDMKENEAPDRYVNREEYEEVMDIIRRIGIDDGFIQDPANDGDWLPDFGRRNPFPSSCAIPVWHFSDDDNLIRDR